VVHLLCEQRTARARRDIPCIIIAVSAFAGGEKEEEENRDGSGKRRDFLSIPDWNTGWRVTSEGFLRHVPAVLLCPALARDGSALSPRRREEKNQFAGAAERHDTPRRDRGVRMAG